LILIVSSIPRLTVPGFNGSDKIAHFCEYALLGLLGRRAVSLPGIRGWFLALAIGAVIGACDEIYQRTVPGRVSSPFDWMADVVGSGSGAAAWSVLTALWVAHVIRKGAEGESP
jgi:VanZ family protein